MSAGKIIKHPLLKSESLTRHGIIKRPVVEAKAEARRIIIAAEEQAAATLQQAEIFAQELREAAYQEGLEKALTELTQHLLDARERRERVLIEVEHDILRLAVKLAEKIIGREIERDSAAVADIVAAALRHTRHHDVLVVRVNPADLSVLQTFRDHLDPTSRARYLDIIPDPRVTHGGCIIESESGTIDAQHETQLRVLERALLARATGEAYVKTSPSVPDTMAVQPKEVHLSKQRQHRKKGNDKP